MKQAIIIRADLKMGKGKIATQASHASIAAFLRSRKSLRDEWLASGMKKVVLKVSSEKELKSFYKKVKAKKMPCAIINDAGLTQLEPGTATAIGIGPDREDKMDKITGKLKLL